MNQSASHPLPRRLKICQNTLQALTDKNHSLFQELRTVLWFPKRKPKPVGAISTQCLCEENKPLFCLYKWVIGLIFFPPDLAQSLIDLIETTRCSGSSWRHNLSNSIIDLSKRIRMCAGSGIRGSLFRDDFELKKKKRQSAHIIEMNREWHYLIHLLR